MRQHRAEPTKVFDASRPGNQPTSARPQLARPAHRSPRRGAAGRRTRRCLNASARTGPPTQKTKRSACSKPILPEQAAALKKEISQLENDYERAQVEIRKANPDYAALVQPQPLKFAELQQQLDADTLLLEYALGEEQLWRAITRDS
ncbi:MAG: hypothetical protein IPO77_11140 [Acidobacteria bacterium]|nr:hypothetical protein [Acidobacteriota bacterium]